ncbi:MAG: polysaccharide pyruvyl transferase family protein [Leifsonia sp.]
MKTLVLWADGRSPNLGVRALADGSAALVRRVHPDAQFTFHNFGRPIPQLPVGRFTSLARERVTGRHGMQRWLAGFDLVVDTRSGDSFADIYGMRRLTMMSAIAECAVQAGVPVVLGPQTIGPFETRRGRWLARHSMRRAALVMARDTESARYAASIGRPADVTTTDVVFAIPAEETPKSRDVVLNVSGLLWNGNRHVDADSYRGVVTSLIDELLAAGREVTVLAHVLESTSPDNDVPAVREVAALFPGRIDTVIPESLGDVREAVASAEVVLGSRMHACLNALSLGTPAVPLAYSRKFAPLLSDLGWTATVDLRTDPDPLAAALDALADPELAAAAARTRERAQAALRSAEDAIRGLG